MEPNKVSFSPIENKLIVDMDCEQNAPSSAWVSENLPTVSKEMNLWVNQAQQLASDLSLHEKLITASFLIFKAYQKGGCVYVAGNGGSAADAQHFVAELVVRLYKNRPPLKAQALTVDSSILTAIGNDIGFEHVFSRQIYAQMKPQDVFLGITTSGNSPNMVEAFKACQQLGVKSILLSGFQGGLCAPLADLSLLTPGQNSGQIQQMHLTLYHLMAYFLESWMFPKDC